MSYSGPYTKYATATGLWNLTNNDAEFHFTGSINAESDGGNASAYSKLIFTLTETVNYSITGTFEQRVTTGASSGSSFRLASIYSENDQIGNPSDNIGSPNYWGSCSDTASFGDGLGLITGSNTGTLDPGIYELQVTSWINGGYGYSRGAASSGIDFARFSVPDGGSTVTLMGMALCILGGFARRFKA